MYFATLCSSMPRFSRSSAKKDCSSQSRRILWEIDFRPTASAVLPTSLGTKVSIPWPRNLLTSTATTSAGSICSFKNSTILCSSVGILSATNTSRTFPARKLVLTCDQKASGSCPPRNSSSTWAGSCAWDSHTFSKLVTRCSIGQ